MSCRQPARQVRRSFFPGDDRGPAARHTGERIPGVEYRFILLIFDGLFATRIIQERDAIHWR
ncbi:hypothetical protein DD581_30050 [Klebsiella pneumoniae]|nr:hypothetical protein DD581_30050 [Klebsiella pneumoniae]